MARLGPVSSLFLLLAVCASLAGCITLSGKGVKINVSNEERPPIMK